MTTETATPTGAEAHNGHPKTLDPRNLLRIHSWHAHPSVRSHDELTLGERSADRLRNGMGSWPFVFIALGFLAVWMAYGGITGKSAFDPYPFILLNLVLSCLAALQGAILLIAAKRSDQISAELAQHDFETDRQAEQLIEALITKLGILHEEHRDMRAQFDALTAKIDALKS